MGGGRTNIGTFTKDTFIPRLPNSLVKDHIWPKMQEFIEDVLDVCCVLTRFEAMVSIFDMNCQ